MTDELIDLSRMSADAIRRLRANAESLLASNPNSPKAEKARKTLAAIEAFFEERTLRGKLKSFQEEFPGGFTGDKQRKHEQDFKRATAAECQRAFEAARFETSLRAGKIAPLLADAKRLVERTNFIQGAVEKPKFIDAIQRPDNQRPFLEALYDCLHGPGDPPARLGRFSDALAALETPDRYNLARWTYASYFLFFHDPANNLFVKPTVIQKAMEMAHEPFEYDSRPTEENYRRILAFARRIKEHIAVLSPRDMIDVQSFIWHMAPSGKWAED